MKHYAYSPATGELIQESVIAEWMGSTTIAPPEFDASVSSCFWRDGEWVVVEAEPADYSDIIASRRWQAEVAGITVSGMQIDTGRDSQALITGAAVSAMLDPDYSVRWKTAAGFVDLNAEQIIGLASAVRAHVQACFDREAELLAALDAGTLTDAMLEQGWP